MPFLRNASIRQKLQGIILITSGVALLAALAVFAVYDRLAFMRDKKAEMLTTAQVLGSNSTAALTFGDSSSAEEILSALAAKKNFVRACIYDKQGHVLATYTRKGEDHHLAPPAIQPDGSRVVASHLILFRAIRLAGDPIGTIYLESDLDEFRGQLVSFAGISLVVMLASLSVAFLLSSRLQRVISEPILSLSRTALAVSANENYSIRAQKTSDDEIGFLFDRFNEMLDRIQQRDQALQRAHDELEHRVEERTAHLNSLIEASPLGIVVLDPQGRIRQCNSAFEGLFGYSRSELLGAIFDQVLVPDGLHTEADDNLRFAFQRGSIHRLTRRKRKDGSMVDVELHGVSLSVAGKFAGYLGLYQDITERLRAENELQRAKEAAEAASQAKSEFLANMSHEIRTPMNGILGMTELALDTPLSSEQREYLTTVKASADSLLTIINDILDFSKIEAGKLELEPAEFSLRESLGETMKTLAFRAHQKGLELAYRVRPDVPESMVGDPGRLRQILVNLVGNAIKFTSKGEVVVDVKLDSAKDRKAIVHFMVRDTGIGIPADKQHVIFDAFTQADSSMTRRYGGTGLGLAITKRLVQKMKGKVWLESQVGIGSTFHFTAVFDVLEGRQAAPSLELTQLRGVRVLVVDDNQTNRFILTEMLHTWGMEPTEVPDARTAMRTLAWARESGRMFPLILLDAQMPEIDGFQFAEMVRRHPVFASVQLIMLSSSGSRSEGSRSQESGINAYLTKPAKPSELLIVILTVLSRRRGSAQSELITSQAITEKRRAHMRILLAEDNLVNRQLARKLVEKQGHQVIVAENGTEVLRSLERESVDLILMDVQMPEMDGFEATAAIREKERESGEHIPIIALTAHAMKGDRERCLTAGMDDYLSKPIRSQELYDLLDRYAPKSRETDASKLLAQELQPAEIWNLEEALHRVDGDRELLAELAKLFEEEYPKRIFEIRQALERRDAKLLERAAHTLKGSAGNFAAHGVTSAAFNMESVARGGDLTAARQSLGAIESEVARLLPALQQFCRGIVSQGV